MGQVVVTKKPEQKKRCASGIESLKTYRIVEIRKDERDDAEEAKVDDIIVGIPSRWSSTAEILNTRTGKLLHRTQGLLDRIICVRDFSIQSVTLAFDENEMPA